MTEHTRVLKVRPNDARFTRRFSALLLVAGGELGAIMLEAGVGAASEDVLVHVWREARAGDPLHVHLSYDTKLPATWISVFGSTEERRAALLETLDLVIPAIPVAQLQKAALRAREPNALLRLALALDDVPSPSAAAIFEKALRSPRPAFRIAAASAMGVLKWARLRASLERALAKEGDETTRRVMEAALRACERPL